MEGGDLTMITVIFNSRVGSRHSLVCGSSHYSHFPTLDIFTILYRDMLLRDNINLDLLDIQ